MTGESGPPQARPPQAGPPPPARRPGGWLLPVAVALLTLAAIAGAVARQGLDLDQNGPLSANRDAVVAIAVVFTVANVVVVLTVAVLIRRRRRRRRMPDSPPLEEAPVPAWALWLRRLAVFAFFFLLLAPLLLLISSLEPTRTDTGDRHGNEPHLPDDILPSLSPAQRNLLLLAAVLGAVLAVLAMLRRGSRRVTTRAGVFDGPPEVPGLAEAISAGGSALRKPSVDARAAIIACYAAMERALAEHGAAREIADTPAELLDRAVGAGLIRSDAALRLTDLFREARFSSHPMSETARTAATAALTELADDLYAVRR
jgi:ABC-type Fe3+ transport system permease subunit